MAASFHRQPLHQNYSNYPPGFCPYHPHAYQPGYGSRCPCPPSTPPNVELPSGGAKGLGSSPKQNFEDIVVPPRPNRNLGQSPDGGVRAPLSPQSIPDRTNRLGAESAGYIPRPTATVVTAPPMTSSPRPSTHSRSSSTSTPSPAQPASTRVQHHRTSSQARSHMSRGHVGVEIEDEHEDSDTTDDTTPYPIPSAFQRLSQRNFDGVTAPPFDGGYNGRYASSGAAAHRAETIGGKGRGKVNAPSSDGSSSTMSSPRANPSQFAKFSQGQSHGPQGYFGANLYPQQPVMVQPQPPIFLHQVPVIQPTYIPVPVIPAAYAQYPKEHVEPQKPSTPPPAGKPEEVKTNKWATADTLLPALDPRELIAVAGPAGTEVNPCLLHTTEGYPLYFDLRFSPSHILRLDGKEFSDGSQPAVLPRAKVLRLICPSTSWTIEIKNSKGVSVMDVFKAVYADFQKDLTPEEWKGAGDEKRALVGAAYHRNRKVQWGGTPGPSPLGEGAKRIDWLLDYTFFEGIKRDSQLSRDRFGYEDAMTFVVQLSSNVVESD